MALLYLICLLFCVANIHAQKDPNIVDGRSAIVHLFEWKFSDIADECERFLAPRGFAGVQVSPVLENLVIDGRPWYERYQVMSYNIITRSGDEAAFRDMVRRCNNVGVRIYVDVVFNHMTGDYPNATGVGGCTADTYNLQYPCVPYGPEHFHPPCEITDWNDPWQIRNCELLGLHDLNQTLPYVRQKIIEAFDRLIDAGVAGFRIDAAKHMSPEDLRYIFWQLKDLNTIHGFAPGTRAFIYQEVIYYGADVISPSEYTDFGIVTEFRYGQQLSLAFRGNISINKLYNFGEPWGFVRDGDALVFVDNHDTQRDGYPILTYKESKLYKMAVAFMLAWPYGHPRVMSSFFFYFNNTAQGPPHDANYNILSPIINSDGTCGNGWVCEHRWRQIFNMVEFRNVVAGTGVNDWWDNGNQLIAFCRGGKGFIAFNDQLDTDFNVNLQTCLPEGRYCDVISGPKSNGTCTGKTVTVGSDGTANIVILHDEEDGVLAIHVESKL